jgi:hypothetical protein
MKSVAKEVRSIFKPLPSYTPLSSGRGRFLPKIRIYHNRNWVFEVIFSGSLRRRKLILRKNTYFQNESGALGNIFKRYRGVVNSPKRYLMAVQQTFWP